MYRVFLLVVAIIFSSPLHSKKIEDYERLYRYLPCAGLQNKVFDINAKYKGGTDKQKKEYWKAYRAIQNLWEKKDCFGRI